MVKGSILTLAAAAALCTAFSMPLRARAAVTWEYKFLLRSRQCLVTPPATQSSQATIAMSPWALYDDTKPVPQGTEFGALVRGLGAKGWELAAVSSRASLPQTNCLGATSDETWVFKRRRP